LEGFAPTSEMPEIAAAQAMLAALEDRGGQKPRLFGRAGAIDTASNREPRCARSPGSTPLN
jgi:hypothetical protein